MAREPDNSARVERKIAQARLALSFERLWDVLFWPFLILAGSAVLVTGGLFFDLPLPLAVIGHEGGTVLVVLNGLRLLADGIRGGDGSAPVQRQPDPPTSVRPEFPSRTTSPTAS